MKTLYKYYSAHKVCTNTRRTHRLNGETRNGVRFGIRERERERGVIGGCKQREWSSEEA